MKNNVTRKLLQFSFELKDNLISDIQDYLKSENVSDTQRSLINYVIDSSIKNSVMSLSDYFVDDIIKEVKKDASS